jgi:Domain of unknown function (DUF4202)
VGCSRPWQVWLVSELAAVGGGGQWFATTDVWHRYNGLPEHSVLLMTMSSDQDVSSRTRFEQAIARFDAANAEDRNKEREEGREFPKELLYAQRMSAMLERFAPEASEAVSISAAGRFRVPTIR